VWIKNRWLRALLMLPLALLPMHAKDIEEILRVMNEAKVEFTIPDEDDKGDANQLAAGGNRARSGADQARPVAYAWKRESSDGKFAGMKVRITEQRLAAKCSRP